MRAYAAILVGLLGCSKAGPPEPAVPPAQPVTSTPSPAFKAAPAPKASGITVQMTAATLADDCGGRAPTSPPAPRAMKQKSATKADVDDSAGAGKRDMKAKRKCEQTSMQLSVVSAADAKATTVTVKKVELFDEAGTSLGELTVRSPTVWSADASVYQPWDEKIAPAQDLSVSYVLSQPTWGPVAERRNKTYVLKAVVTVGGADQTVQQNVDVSAETSLPANVKT